MKVYARWLHRHVERQIHFGVGKSVKTACGLVLFSRHTITSDLGQVMCKRCLQTRQVRLMRLIKIGTELPGLLDHPALCGEDWLLKHALDVSPKEIDSQQMTVVTPNFTITLSSAMKRKELRDILANIKATGGIE